MKMNPRITAAAILFAAKALLPGAPVLASANSRDFSLGIEAGAGTGNNQNSGEYSGMIDNDSQSGGLVMDYGGPIFGIRPSVLYTHRDMTYHTYTYQWNNNTNTDDIKTSDQRFEEDQLEIPLLFRVSLPISPVKPVLLIGPRLMLPISGGDQVAGETDQSLPLGFTLGVGMDVPMGKQVAMVSARYDIGVDGLANGTGGELKVMVGMGFDLWHGKARSAQARRGRRSERGLVSSYQDLRELRHMLKEGLISREEYQDARQEITDRSGSHAADADMPPDPAQPGIMPSAQIAQGRKLYEDGKFEKAEAYFRWLSEEKPHDAEPLRYLGNCMWAQGQQQEAADILAKAADLDPQHPALKLWLKSQGY